MNIGKTTSLERQSAGMSIMTGFLFTIKITEIIWKLVI